SGKRESCHENFAAADREFRERSGNTTQHVASAAADFEHGARMREIRVYSVDDQFVACAKPEVAFFQLSQARKVFGSKTRRLVGQFGCVAGNTFHRGCEVSSAGRAWRRMRFGTENMLAMQTAIHPAGS